MFSSPKADELGRLLKRPGTRPFILRPPGTARLPETSSTRPSHEPCSRWTAMALVATLPGNGWPVPGGDDCPAGRLGPVRHASGSTARPTGRCGLSDGGDRPEPESAAGHCSGGSAGAPAPDAEGP